MKPGAGEHSCWLRPPVEEQPSGESQCPRNSVICFKSYVKTCHLGSQHGKHGNKDSEVGVWALERQVEIVRRSVHRRQLEDYGAEIDL